MKTLAYDIHENPSSVDVFRVLFDLQLLWSSKVIFSIHILNDYIIEMILFICEYSGF